MIEIAGTPCYIFGTPTYTKRVRSMFTWDHVAAQLAEVYDEVCDPLGTPGLLSARSRPLRLVSSRPLSPRLGVSLVH